GCTALTAIPSGLKVGGDLDLSNCTSLIFLPEGLEVQAMLDLLRCIALTTLPNGLKVKGDLDLSDCTSLTLFPEKLEVQGRLSLSGCTALTAIPKGFKVEGSLDCSDCKGLTHIPEGLNVPGNLNLSHCISLTALPNGLKVGGDFNLSGCKQLTRLPEELEVQGRFNLSHCTALTTIPKGFKVKKSLNLSHCTSLTHLPEELEVQGRLNLFGCTALITMPSRLQVKNSLNLSHCIQLTTLPDQLELGGDLDLNGCTSLSSLPHWVATLGYCSDGDIRSIDLTGSGLSPLIIQRLQAEALNHAGVQFYFSEDAAEAYIMEFEALLPALEFWEKEAKEAPIDLETICYKLHQLLTQVQDHENLLTFLMRLTGTADFYNAATRECLAKRVLKLIQLMAQNTEICHHAAFLIHQGLSSCDDRVMTTLSDMGFYQKLQDLQHPSVKAEELKKSAKGFFFLEQLSQKIEKHINTLQFVDEVEVYMAFHIRLQKMLNLPIDIQNMLFRKCVAISNEEIDHIGKELLEGFSEEAFNSFLMSWDPWNLYQRRLSVLDWDHLPMANKRMFSTDICPYLQDLPTRPVLYNHVVYDYDAFVKRYIQEGVDLYGVKVHIKNLLRMKYSLAESSTLEDGKEEDSLIKQELKKLKK
ncbi:MAG: NEL-type E3 ubiquitin ligase domain-containing protein, partial [Candidatus Rhabdochlamydia sp.]